MKMDEFDKIEWRYNLIFIVIALVYLGLLYLAINL